MAAPVLPPTWNRDCAIPCWPPEAMRATREDSGVEDRGADTDQRRRDQHGVEMSGKGEQQQAAERHAHAERQRIGFRILIGVKADEGLQQRGGDLEGHRDQADLAEAEPERFLENRIDCRHQRLDGCR